MIENKPVEVIEVGLLELLLAVAKRKRFVIGVTLATAILITVTCFIIPLKWSSEAQITPIADNTSSLQFNSDLLNSLSSLPVVSSEKMDMALDFITIIDSRTFREAIIRKFGLIKYFKINKPDSTVAMEIALLNLNDKIMRVNLETETNVIRIAAVTKDKYLSRQIAEYTIASLENYIQHQKKIKSKITREFLEHRTLAVESEVDTLMMLKKKFEASDKAYSLGEQTTQALAVYSGLISDKINNDIELEIARQQSGNNHPKVNELAAKSELLAGKIRDYEDNNSGSLPKYMLQLKDLPNINMQFEKLNLDLMVKNTVYKFLFQALEAARLTEEKDMPALEVLDKPSLAGLHTYPKRLLLVSLFTIAALLTACILAILDAYLPEEAKIQLHKLRREMFGAGSTRNAAK